jgi:OOP family OmpA-OmpF porin
MTRLLSERLRQVHGGRLQVSGTRIALQGNVANEALRQQVVSEMATVLNPTYTIDNGLVVAGGGQGVLDKTLSNRVVEFETASARLTPAGSRILDEMAEAIKRIGTPRLQLIGHTDSAGKREANVELSLARANSVRAYLIDKGIPAASLSTSGAGPDRPLGSNDTAEGRARNRRIEFRLNGWRPPPRTPAAGHPPIPAGGRHAPPADACRHRPMQRRSGPRPHYHNGAGQAVFRASLMLG